MTSNAHVRWVPPRLMDVFRALSIDDALSAARILAGMWYPVEHRIPYWFERFTDEQLQRLADAMDPGADVDSVETVKLILERKPLTEAQRAFGKRIGQGLASSHDTPRAQLLRQALFERTADEVI